MGREQRHALRNIIETENIYNGAILDLNIDRVLFPSGCEKIREVVRHRSAVTVLPVHSDGKISLVRQYRHAVDEDLYEIPAGLPAGRGARALAIIKLASSPQPT